MTETSKRPRKTTLDLPDGYFYAVLAVLLIAHAAIVFMVAPVGDEAYYWMWGQNLAWSYFDHPPLNAWVLRLSETLFGWNLFALRFPTWIALGVTAFVAWDWAGRLKPEKQRTLFLATMTAYLGAPLFFLFTSIVFNDYLLIAFCILSAHFFVLVFADQMAGKPVRVGALYLAALFLGLAALTKYNALFLGVAAALSVLLVKDLRGLLRSPHLYLAALLAIAMQAPVLIWNLTEGFASYEFHLNDRFSMGGKRHFYLEWTIGPLASTFWSLTPVLSVVFVRQIWRRAADPFLRSAQWLGALTFVTSSLTMLAIATGIAVPPYWNIVAYTVFIPLIGYLVMRPFWFHVHLVLGGIIIALVVVTGLVFPIISFDRKPGFELAILYGWPELGAVAGSVIEAEQPDFIAATRYTLAAQFGFQLGRPDVVALARRHDQYDFWFDAEAHKGETAIVLDEDHNRIDSFIAPLFEQCTEIRALDVERFDVRMNTFRLYRCTGFLGLSEPPAS